MRTIGLKSFCLWSFHVVVENPLIMWATSIIHLPWLGMVFTIYGDFGNGLLLDLPHLPHCRCSIQPKSKNATSFWQLEEDSCRFSCEKLNICHICPVFMAIQPTPRFLWPHILIDGIHKSRNKRGCWWLTSFIINRGITERHPQKKWTSHTTNRWICMNVKDRNELVYHAFFLCKHLTVYLCLLVHPDHATLGKWNRLFQGQPPQPHPGSSTAGCRCHQLPGLAALRAAECCQ